MEHVLFNEWMLWAKHLSSYVFGVRTAASGLRWRKDARVIKSTASCSAIGQDTFGA